MILTPFYTIFGYSFYSKVKKEEEERQAEWANKYRDRVNFNNGKCSS